MVDESIGPLIRRLRRERGLTQGQLATFANQSRSWVSAVEKGRIEQPDRETLETVARVLRVPPETLWAAAGYRVTPLPLREQRSPLEIVRELEATLRRSGIIEVPVAPGPASAGGGSPGDTESVPFRPPKTEQDDLYEAIEVVGDCLMPRLTPGHHAIVNYSRKPEPGDIVLASDHGEMILKVYEVDAEGREWLTTMNDQPPIPVNGGVKIRGVVRFAGKYRP